MTYKLKESGKHDYSKKLVAQILTNAGRVCNRKCAWQEYPIFTDQLADEYLFEERYNVIDNYSKKYTQKDCVQQLNKSEFVPTYDFCKRNGYNPVAVVDVACAWKGIISEIWEITNSNPLTREKVEKIVKVIGYDVEIYEINCDDVMKLDIYSSNLYEDIVKKAKKWDLNEIKYEIKYEIEYNKWITNIINKYEKFGYSVDLNESKEALYDYLCLYRYHDRHLKITNNNVFRVMFDLKISPRVKGKNIVCNCGNLFNNTACDLSLIHI